MEGSVQRSEAWHGSKDFYRYGMRPLYHEFEGDLSENQVSVQGFWKEGSILAGLRCPAMRRRRCRG